METHVLGFSELKEVSFTKLLVRMSVDSIGEKNIHRFRPNLQQTYQQSQNIDTQEGLLQVVSIRKLITLSAKEL